MTEKRAGSMARSAEAFFCLDLFTEPHARKRPTEKRAGRMACSAEAFFCLDVIHVLFVFLLAFIISLCSVFGTFLYQDKKGLAPAAIERCVFT
jgi:hypothetical protein